MRLGCMWVVGVFFLVVLVRMFEVLMCPLWLIFCVIVR